MSVSVENLSFSYCTHDVLDNVSFQAEAGELLAVLGPNGVGKTTLFRCILGLQRNYTGTIRINGDDTKALSTRELAHRVAYISQLHGQTFAYSVLDMVLMGTSHTLSAIAVPGRRETETAMAALENLGVANLAKKNFSHLSGGEQQLVLIARALAQQTKTLLMDEPTASLDYGNQSQVLDTVRKLVTDGYSVILTTHNPQHALWYADKALAISEGRSVAFGTPRDIIVPELIKKLYGVRVDVFDTEGGALIAPIPERRGSNVLLEYGEDTFSKRRGGKYAAV